MFTMEDMRKAIRLYNYTFEHGELSSGEDQELFQYYSDPQVHQILEAFEEESHVKIRKYDDTIYFMPDVDNEFLGYKRAELKKEIFTRADMKNIDLFLAMYIMIQLTAEFYSGKGSNVKVRDLIQLGELDESVTNRLELFTGKAGAVEAELEDGSNATAVVHGKADVAFEQDSTGISDEQRAQIEADTGLVIGDIAKYWFTLTNEDDAAVLRTRRWYIVQVMNFLKKEKLITIQDETVIIPTSKFNRLAANYFLNFERLEDINQILGRMQEVANAKA